MSEPLLRDLLGGALKHQRLIKDRTLRGVSFRAKMSLGYLSEIERGMKEPSSEVLRRVCLALNLPLADLLRTIADDLDLITGREEVIHGTKVQR